MPKLGLSFQNLSKALDCYREQLSKGILFVESFESLPRDSEVLVNLILLEPRREVECKATVQRMIGRREATEQGYGNSAGVLLAVPINAGNRDLLRAFFAAEERAQAIEAPVEKRVLTPQAEPLPETLVADYLSASSNASLYRSLGLLPTASNQEIRVAYSNLVRQFHPDSYFGALNPQLELQFEQAYQQINEAYEILSKPVFRKIYDTVSRQLKRPLGVTYEAYTKFLQDYRNANGAQIRQADDLYQQAIGMDPEKQTSEMIKTLELALSFDALHPASIEKYEELLLLKKTIE